mmetsp:Transcript_30649/g.68730  ORF Transcript_30649/g.68730 Transcript_30649/m.68730 type:complete len:249 (-) Transcript_30649:293-1039(-)
MLRCLLQGLLIVDPTRIDGGHVDSARLSVLLGRRARHHVQRRLGHVGMRVVGRLEPVELALHRRHVHDELGHGLGATRSGRVPLALRGRLGRLLLARHLCGRVDGEGRAALHEFPELAVEDEGREGVDGHHLGGLARRHLVQLEQPRVHPPQVHLLLVHVQVARREGRLGAPERPRALASLDHHRAAPRRHRPRHAAAVALIGALTPVGGVAPGRVQIRREDGQGAQRRRRRRRSSCHAIRGRALGSV